MWLLLLVKKCFQKTETKQRYPFLKESMFGSLEQQKRQAVCLHEWKEKKGIIFDYIVVSSRCKLCGTYKK